MPMVIHTGKPRHTPPAVSLEAAQLAMGGPRIKYGAVRAGPSPAFLGDERLWRCRGAGAALLDCP